MFSGIISQVGLVTRCSGSKEKKEFAVEILRRPQELKLGDSIAINGVCQTIKKIDADILYFYAMKQTLDTTTLDSLKVSDKVNVEFALKINSDISGHFVLGHVDTTARILNIKKKPDAAVFSVELDKKYAHLIVDKGSIALNGISLTISDKNDKGFSVNVIPQTLQQTTLKYAKIGNKVNLEFDILAKYAQADKTSETSGRDKQVTIGLLKEKGYIR
jgi:riboflavin synthase